MSHATKRRIIQFIALMLVCIALATLASKAEGTPEQSVVPISVHPHPRMPAKDIEATAKKGARKWRHDKLGNSAGRYVPDKMKDVLWKYKHAHPGDVKKWWVGALEKTECYYNISEYPSNAFFAIPFCMKYGDKPTIHTINHKMVRVRLFCSAGAVAALVPGGGEAEVYAIFKSGASGCGIGAALTKFVNWMPRASHGRKQNK